MVFVTSAVSRREATAAIVRLDNGVGARRLLPSLIRDVLLCSLAKRDAPINLRFRGRPSGHARRPSRALPTLVKHSGQSGPCRQGRRLNERSASVSNGLY